MDLWERIDTGPIEAVGHVFGIAAVLVATAGLVLSIAFTDQFRLQEHALSDLGAPSADAAWLFNGTVILAGLLALVFCLSIWRQIASRYQRGGVALFALSAVGAIGVGVFPLGHTLHVPAAVMFFVGVTTGLLVSGYADWINDRPRRARVFINLGVLHILAWAFAWWALEGVALPELVGIAAFGLWIIVMVIQRGRVLDH